MRLSAPRIYDLGGCLSVLPAIWEARIDGHRVLQVDPDGQIRRQRYGLPLEKLQYWGVLCREGRFGFDVEKGVFSTPEGDFPFDTPDVVRELVFSRQVIADSFGNSDTVDIEFGLNDVKAILRFIPSFAVEFPSNFTGFRGQAA